MKYGILTAPSGHRDTVVAAFEHRPPRQVWWDAESDHSPSFTVRFITAPDEESRFLDELQRIVASAEGATMYLMNVDSSFPGAGTSSVTPKLSREELLGIAERGASIDPLFYLLVMLSTIVAAIGLMGDNIAVVIGAMVIAPLLGPNLSVALAIALGEFVIARRALISLVTGTLLAFIMSIIVGILARTDSVSQSILERTESGIDSALLALASGCAAILSMTSGVQGVLVGVMVAVALLPPLASAGMLFGMGELTLGIAALLLFGINVAAINFSAHLTLLLASVRPRTAYLANIARRNSLVSISLWLILLLALSWLSVNGLLAS